MERRTVRRFLKYNTIKFNKNTSFGINCTIRREMGRDINGACGQLRKSFIDKSISL